MANVRGWSTLLLLLIATILTCRIAFPITIGFITIRFVSLLGISLSDLLGLPVREIRRHAALIFQYEFPVQAQEAPKRAAKELYMSSTIRGASGSETNRSRLNRRYAVRALPTRVMRCAIIARWRADDVVDFEAASQKQNFGLSFLRVAETVLGSSWGFKTFALWVGDGN